MAPLGLRGRLDFAGNGVRLVQCHCEPIATPPLNVLLAVASGVPDDLTGAGSYLSNLGWMNGTCVEIVGNMGVIGGTLSALYLQQICHCPNGPCNR